MEDARKFKTEIHVKMETISTGKNVAKYKQGPSKSVYLPLIWSRRLHDISSINSDSIGQETS